MIKLINTTAILSATTGFLFLAGGIGYGSLDMALTGGQVVLLASFITLITKG